MRMRARHPLLLLVVSMVLAVLAGPAVGQVSSGDRQPRPVGAEAGQESGRTLDRNPLPVPWIPSSRDGALPTFVGQDGLIYSATALVVPGKKGVVYIGQDFDAACAYGRKLRLALRQLGRLVNTIEKTGRRVVFTVAPNKSAVNKAGLPDALPHGLCDAVAIAEQDQILDTYQDPSYVQLRRKFAALTAKGGQVYWNLDTHWNSVATGMYADAVARKLDPHLAKVQSCSRGRETIFVDLAFLGVLAQQHETGPGCLNTTNVKVRPAAGSPPFDPSTMIDGEVAWTTRPSQRTWPGKTALVGDSFTYRGLDNLMPLFRRGHFLWLGAVDSTTIIDAIGKSDTVVLESVQRFLGASPITSSLFRLEVKKAMAAHDRQHPRR